MAKRNWMEFASVMAGIAMALLAVLMMPSGAGAESYRQEGTDEIPYPDPAEAVSAAAAWLLSTHQNADGGFSSFSAGAGQAPSDAGGTLDALLALGAAGADTESAKGFLTADRDALVAYVATDGSTAGKTILALTAAGEDPRNFAGHDFVLDLVDHLTPNGDYSVTTAFNQSLAILALSAVGEEIPEDAVQWLISGQETDGELMGSWDDGFGTAGNADATAMAMMALLATGRDASDQTLSSALNFLEEFRLASGGWEYGLGFGENANSTALVLQALDAAGQDLTGEGRWAIDGLAPVNILLRWQGESGAFQADFGEGRFDDFFSTVQSIPAVTLFGSNESMNSGSQNLIPYVIVGVVVVVVAGLILWYVNSRGKDQVQEG